MNKRIERLQKQQSENKRKEQEYHRIAAEQRNQFKNIDCPKYGIKVKFKLIYKSYLVTNALLFRVKKFMKNYQI